MIWWRRYVEKREALLSAESEPVKTVLGPKVGFDLLLPNSNADDLQGLLRFVTANIERADEFFAAGTPTDVRRENSDLVFATPVRNPASGPNDLARARLFEVKNSKSAVILLPHWNSAETDYDTFARIVSFFGIACLQVTLPYHGKRATPGVGFARELVSDNLGETILSNRQAITETRAWLSWLKERGYNRLGIVGVSIGSSIASIVAALDERVQAAALLLMADDFAEVVWTGTATSHVKRSLQRRFSLNDVRHAWSIISPSTYAAKLAARLQNVLIISGSLDKVFVPELTLQYVERLKHLGLAPTWVRLSCGHYTLSLLPYSAIAVIRTLLYLNGGLR